MNRIIHLSILFLFCIQLYGQEVSIETARRVAENFFGETKRNQFKNLTKQILRHDRTVEYDGIPLYYVFNTEDDNGYILVSGNYSLYPILGFSHEGSFRIDDVPPAFSDLLTNYQDNVIEILERKAGSVNIYKTIWERYSNPSFIEFAEKGEEIPNVKPLIRSKWNSGCIYNSHCPADEEGPCGHVKVGCVAVAMAQIMNYYEHPERGSGSVIYLHESFGELYVNYDSAFYEWNRMPNRLTKENDHVAQLMYHCGVAARMNYGPDFSCASMRTAGNAMISHFNYSGEKRSQMDSMKFLTEWGNMLRKEIDNFRPVFCAGSPPDHGENHAYIIDGYYGTELIHYNWGWGGKHDGYHAVGAPYVWIGVEPESCIADTVVPNLVQDLSYQIDEDTIIVSWELPEAAADGDYASQFNLIKDDTHDLFTYSQQFRFIWDTIGTYRIKIRSYDDCMHPSDGFSELEVILPDTVNYHPRIESFAPKYVDTIPVYSGVYKGFEIQASDPNEDELTYSWQLGEDEISEGLAPRLVHDFRELEPGIHTLHTVVSDLELTRQKTWFLKKIPGDLAITDDSDSIRMVGKWYQRLGMDAFGNQCHWTKQWDYFEQPVAEYIYIPEFTGSYEISAYIPAMANLSDQVDYLVSMDNIPLDTFRISQLDATGSWITLGVVELSSEADVVIQVANIDNKPSDKFMVIDAIRFRMGVFDYQAPIIFVEDSVLVVSDTSEVNFIHFTVTENSKVYLVPENTGQNLTDIQFECIDSVEAIADTLGFLSVYGFDNGVYWLFAIDSAGNISEPGIFSITGVGISYSRSKYFKIYPNPANTLLNIEATTPDIYNIKIVSINGQPKYSQIMKGPTSQIDLSSFQSGVYFITIRSKNFLTTERIIKL